MITAAAARAVRRPFPCGASDVAAQAHRIIVRFRTGGDGPTPAHHANVVATARHAGPGTLVDARKGSMTMMVRSCAGARLRRAIQYRMLQSEGDAFDPRNPALGSRMNPPHSDLY